jgi:hypothetical protein
VAALQYGGHTRARVLRGARRVVAMQRRQRLVRPIGACRLRDPPG